MDSLPVSTHPPPIFSLSCASLAPVCRRAEEWPRTASSLQFPVQFSVCAAADRLRVVRVSLAQRSESRVLIPSAKQCCDIPNNVQLWCRQVTTRHESIWRRHPQQGQNAAPLCYLGFDAQFAQNRRERGNLGIQMNFFLLCVLFLHFFY